MGINGKLIYDGESYALFQRYRLGIRHPMLCTFVAVLKETGSMKAATFREKVYLISVVGELAKLGVPLGAEQFEELFERFTEAVFAGEEHVVHRLFFEDCQPRERAAEIADS